MSKAWPLVKLGEVLEKSQNWVNLDTQEEYKEITVRLWGKGVTLRGMVTGSQIAGSRRLQVHSNQFILSRIDARNGAFGLIPDELDNAVVSNDFPVFDIHQHRLLPKYLHWLSKTKNFVESCKSVSEGTTNRVRLKEDKFIQIEIPLPPLAEQQRIVAKIERLAGKIEEAHKLRQKTKEQVKIFFESYVSKRFSYITSYSEKGLINITSKIGSGSTPKGGRANYPNSGIPFIRSLNIRMRYFQWDEIAYISTYTHNQMANTKVHPNDVLLNITGASIGRVACAPSNIEEANVNQHVAIIRPTESLNSRYLMYWLSQPSIQDFIKNEQKGATRQGFTKSQIEAFNIPVPPLHIQQQIITELDSLQTKIDNLKSIQAQTTAELDAMLPSILDKAFKGEL